MGMQGEDVPQKDGGVDALENTPDNSGSPFRHRLSFCRTLGCNAPAGRVRLDMHVVGQGKARPSAATIAEIAANPNGVYLDINRRLQNRGQNFCPGFRRSRRVVNGASVRVRVEGIFKLQVTQRAHKIAGLHVLVPLIGDW